MKIKDELDNFTKEIKWTIFVVFIAIDFFVLAVVILLHLLFFNT